MCYIYRKPCPWTVTKCKSNLFSTNAKIKKQSQSRILLSICSPGSPCILSSTYFQVSFNNKNRLFNFDLRLQCMLVSRTNIRRLYWAICSLQSRAVAHNQFKSSSTLTFSRTQYPKPLSQETILVKLISHIRPPLRGFSWWGYPCQDTVPQFFSYCRTQNTFPTTWRNPFLHTWKKKKSSLLCSSASWSIFGNISCLWAGSQSSFLGCSAQDPFAHPPTADVTVMVSCVSCHGFPNCPRSHVCFFII